MGLIEEAAGGSTRALARLATLIEHDDETSLQILRRVFPMAGNARTIGVTGPPGAGKSSLINGLINGFRARKQRVAVVAVDPSSPISGGATLGDRIRMLDQFQDSGVFVRSMASRGKRGGLATTTPAMMHLFDAVGFDIVVIETVGIGQEEIDVSRYVETTMLIQAPGLGDSIQAMKAGILEVADIYVVNKADLPGAAATAREIRTMLQLGAMMRRPTDWTPSIVKVSAKDNTGFDELVIEFDRQQRALDASGERSRRRGLAAKYEIEDRLDAMVRSRLSMRPDISQQLIDDVASRKRDPFDAAASVLSALSQTQNLA